VLDQYTLARLLATGAYDRQLRRRYRARRDALAGALARWLPGAVVHGVSAGIQPYVELPPGCDEAVPVAGGSYRRSRPAARRSDGDDKAPRFP
jgi:DNA-binding transcriptional MocR family regulator